MTEAAYWLAFCEARYPGPITSDPFCVRMLSEAAGPAWVSQMEPNRAYRPGNVGADGWVWTFRDTSQLLVNSNRTLILGDPNAT